MPDARRFTRSDFPTRAVASAFGTVRDFAIWTFSAHRSITDCEIAVMTPTSGHVTIRIVTPYYEQARAHCEQWYEERAPRNAIVHVERLALEPTEQGGLF